MNRRHRASGVLAARLAARGPARGAALLTAAILLAAVSAPAEAATERRGPGCNGVRITTDPFVAIGVGSVVFETSGGRGGPVLCKRGPLPPDGGGGPVEVDLPGIEDLPDLPGLPGGDLPDSPDLPGVGDILPRRAQASGRCANARRAAFKLRARQAAKAVRCLINKRRSRRGLNRLGASKPLKRAAKKHTRRMIETGCFAHRCSGEPDLVGRVRSTGYLPCNCGWAVGENLAWGARAKSRPATIVAAWMNSPPHRANILKKGYRDVDVGVQRGKPGKRKKRRAATYTANFGYRR